MADAPTLAEGIRHYAIEHHVEPARRAEKRTVTIRAGDVHRDLGLTSRIPAVCSALRSELFERLAGVVLIEHTGPTQSTTTQFRYSLVQEAGDATAVRVPATVRRLSAPMKELGQNVRARASVDSIASDAGSGQRLFLVSCVKTKLPRAAKAKDLYVSDWFRKARTYVEREDGAWRILSAKYGLVHPEELVQPYEKTLTTMRAAERRTWTDSVLDALESDLADADTVVVLAGKRYREFLEPALTSRGIAVEVPMRRLSQGRQLAWLGARLRG